MTQHLHVLILIYLNVTNQDQQVYHFDLSILILIAAIQLGSKEHARLFVVGEATARQLSHFVAKVPETTDPKQSLPIVSSKVVYIHLYSARQPNKLTYNQKYQISNLECFYLNFQATILKSLRLKLLYKLMVWLQISGRSSYKHSLWWNREQPVRQVK